MSGQQHLPVNSRERKTTPVYSGVVSYFPDAIAAVAEVSYIGNQKHNPGEPLRWARDKSNDHLDCIARHLVDAGTIDDEDGLLHSAKLAWRALANLQLEIEQNKNSKHSDLTVEDGQRASPPAVSQADFEAAERLAD